MKKFYFVTNKSFEEKGVSTVKELWEKVKGDHQGFSFDVESAFTKAESDNKFHVTFSTDTEDRHLDRVYQNFDLKSFKKNPVLLDSHNYSSIEHIIGKVESIKVKDGALQGDVVFALDNPKGLLAMKLADKGFINATSIGFIPLDFDEEGNITKSELLEISAVSVPANPEALFEKAVKTLEEIEEKGVEEVVMEYKRKEIIAYRAVKRLRDDQRSLLIAIAKGLEIENPQERKRKIYKSIRENLK